MHSSVDVDAVQTRKSSVKMVLGLIPAGGNPKQTVFSLASYLTLLLL